jgi:hypothetical protein
MQKNGLPWHEAVAKRGPMPMSVAEIKAWRTREAAAGRPSSFAEFCRTHGLCVSCLGEGLTHNDNGVGFKVVGMDGDTQLFEQCSVCGGTGLDTER